MSESRPSPHPSPAVRSSRGIDRAFNYNRGVCSDHFSSPCATLPGFQLAIYTVVVIRALVPRKLVYVRVAEPSSTSLQIRRGPLALIHPFHESVGRPGPYSPRHAVVYPLHRPLHNPPLVAPHVHSFCLSRAEHGPRDWRQDITAPPPSSFYPVRSDRPIDRAAASRLFSRSDVASGPRPRCFCIFTRAARFFCRAASAFPAGREATGNAHRGIGGLESFESTHLTLSKGELSFGWQRDFLRLPFVLGAFCQCSLNDGALLSTRSVPTV